MLSRRHDPAGGQSDARTAAGEPIRSSSTRVPAQAARYRPSSVFHRISGAGANRARAGIGPVDSAPRPTTAPRAPGMSLLLAAALVGGVISGFLEVAVQVVQVQILHRIDWS